MTTLSHAFISYGRADSKDFAAKLQQRLHAQGFEVWFDFNDIPLAVDYQNQIDDGIEKAHHFLFIISPHSVNSEYCQKEIQLAIKRNKRIIPLLHVMQISRETWQQRNPNGTEVDWEEYKAKGKHDSYQNMHPVIRKLNWVYFEEEKNDFEKSLADLINLLRSHTEYVEQHTQLLAKALEWERHQKQTSYLLIGEERQQAETWLKFRFKNEQPPCVPTDLHCEYITESIKNANNLMTQVFLSYGDEDKAIMEKIRNSLRRESITVWTNKTDIKTGEAFEEAIKRGIEQADNMVYLLSPDAVNSTYCEQELALALSLHKRIIPVLVRTTDPTQVPEALQSLQYIDLTDNVKEEDYLLDESELLKTLYEDAAYYNEHKILLTKALKWQRQQNNPSILLRGYNLRSAETWLQVAQTRKEHPPTALQQEFIAESQRQPPLESLEVFISYSRADSDLARKLNDALQMQGKTTWFDQESIASGTDFEEEIYRGIKVSDNFLFILSPNSVNSPYCAKEVEYAASLNKRFVTVLHREVNPGDLHPELAKVQWIDFKGNQGDFNANFNQLVRTLDTDREHLRSHTKWLQRALEWQQKEKVTDLLLRGSEFAVAQQWLQESEEKNKLPAATPLHKEFIAASQEAIEAGIREEKRRVIILKSLLGLVSAAAIIAVVAGFNAVQSERKAQKAEIQALAQSSEALFDLGEQFNALEAALQAAAKLKATGWDKTDSQLRAEVITKLQQPLYLIQEVNRLEGHQGKIADVSFSPDGKTIATVGYDDKTVKLWQPNGRVISSQPLANSESIVPGGWFSEDGQIIVTNTKDKKVQLWRRDGTFLAIIDDKQALASVVYISPDSQTIATVSKDRKTIKLWGQDGRLISRLEAEKDKFLSAAFSRDGQRIATINYDENAKLYLVKLWQRNGTLTATLEGNNESMTKVNFSPDGAILATAGDNTVKLWRRDGTEIATLPGHKEGINLLQFSPDGQKIVTGSYDGTVKLWQRNGVLDLTFKPHGDNWVSDVSFSTDSAGHQIMATGSPDKTVKLWQIDGTPIVTLTGHGDWVRKVLFSPDGKNLASLSEDTTVKLWQVENKGSIATMPSKDAHVFVNPHQTSQILMTTTDNNGAVTLWKADGNSTTSVPLVKKGGENVDVQFVDKGQTIVTTVRDDNSFGPVQLWKADSTPVATIIDKTPSPVGVSVSPSGETIVTTVREGNSASVKLWKADGTPVATIINKTPSQWVDVDISSDGKTIVTTVRDDNSTSVQLWKADGTEVATFIEKNNDWASVDLSPDGKTVLTVTADDNEDYTVKLWQADGTLIETLMEKSPEMPQWRFSNDGQMLALLDSDGEVKLWNADGTSIATTIDNSQGSTRIAGFSPDNQIVVLVSQKKIILGNRDGSKPLIIPTEHKGEISQVVFSPDGQTIATASYDNTVKLWQRNGQLITTYTHDRGVQKLYFSTDGKLLVSVDEKKTVTLRRIHGMTELEPLVEKGCQWLASYLQNPFPDEDHSDISQFCAALEYK